MDPMLPHPLISQGRHLPSLRRRDGANATCNERLLSTQSGHLLMLVFGRPPERVDRNEMVGRFYQSVKFRLAVETDFISHAIA